MGPLSKVLGEHVAKQWSVHSSHHQQHWLPPAFFLFLLCPPGPHTLLLNCRDRFPADLCGSCHCALLSPNQHPMAECSWHHQPSFLSSLEWPEAHPPPGCSPPCISWGSIAAALFNIAALLVAPGPVTRGCRRCWAWGASQACGRQAERMFLVAQEDASPFASHAPPQEPSGHPEVQSNTFVQLLGWRFCGWNPTHHILPLEVSTPLSISRMPCCCHLCAFVLASTLM